VLLAQKGLLRLVFDGIVTNAAAIYPHPMFVRATLDGVALFYDLADGYGEILQPERYDDQLDACERCFKRSYDREFHNRMRNRWKLRPLGLNYFVTCPGNPLISSMDTRQKYTAEEFMSHNSYPAYKALLLTRLRDPESGSIEALQQRYPWLSAQEALALASQRQDAVERMNQLRIGCVRAGREAFGPRFLGGLECSALAQALAPDLILRPEQTQKNSFLRLLHENYICVAMAGLDHSAGWKMAEYAAAGRAIVTEPLRYQLPGGFKRGQNYAEYTTPEECVQRLDELLENTPRVHRMEAANFTYYCNHVRPDAMVRNSLRDALPSSFS
jgi:hypothetical protein